MKAHDNDNFRTQLPIGFGQFDHENRGINDREIRYRSYKPKLYSNDSLKAQNAKEISRYDG